MFILFNLHHYYVEHQLKFILLKKFELLLNAQVLVEGPRIMRDFTACF